MTRESRMRDRFVTPAGAAMSRCFTAAARDRPAGWVGDGEKMTGDANDGRSAR